MTSTARADTGVAPAPGLDGAGKLVNGPDLSLESQKSAFRSLDTNGHARYFPRSGTSQATAITAGAVALVLQKHPTLTPDRVKKFFADHGVKVNGADSAAQGPGQMNLQTMAVKAPASNTQNFTASTGTGSLDASRGSDRLTDDGVLLIGEKDVFGHTWDSAAMATATAAGNTWSGGAWNGNSWSGNSWSGNSWSGNSWSGNSWSGNSWSGNTWSDAGWN